MIWSTGIFSFELENIFSNEMILSNITKRTFGVTYTEHIFVCIVITLKKFIRQRKISRYATLNQN